MARIAVVGSGAIGSYYGDKLAVAHEQTMLLTLQNGLGNEEFIAKHFGARRVLGGLCFICLTPASRTEVQRYDYGHIVIGEYGGASQPRTDAVAAQFNRAKIICSVTNDLALEHWRKLCLEYPVQRIVDPRRRDRYRGDFGRRSVASRGAGAHARSDRSRQ